MSEQFARRATSGVLLIALLAFLFLVMKSPDRYIYDEHAYVPGISLLHRYGLTTTFLNSLEGAAGPLYAFVQVIFQPLTELRPVRMRLVNIFLLATVAAILATWLRQQKCVNYCVASCSMLVVPMTWAIAGMALTEMPAMVFVTLSLYLQLRGLEALARGDRTVLRWFFVSGVSLGIAVWGRQPYLLLVGVPALLAILERRLRMSALVFGCVVIVFALPLFLIWKGLVPPSNQQTVQGIAPTHSLISLGYTGICFLLLAPGLAKLPSRVVAGLVVLTVIANALTGAVVLYPVRSILDRFISVSALPAFGNLCGSLFLSCGVVFSALLIKLTWDQRKNLKIVAVHAGLLCVAVSPVFVAHQYSSRYTAMSLPYLLLAAQPLRQWKFSTVVTSAVGCGVGFLTLLEYFLFSR
jgi:hypothetical protein